MNSLRRSALACLVVSAVGSAAPAESTLSPGLPAPRVPDPILCVGDSLTYGEGGNGVTYPGVLSSLSKANTVNQGLSGWIPRHIVYYVLLHDVPVLSVVQLRGVPPSEYEERRNQPGINALRTFIKAGQEVWVADPTAGGGPPRKFAWDPSSTSDGPEAIRPLAVGDVTHRPAVPTGRWIAEVSHGPVPSPAPAYSGIIFCVGANGMEADDVHKSLQSLIRLLVPRDGHFLVLGLINRADPNRDPRMVRDWAGHIEECNQVIHSDYPDHFIDLQAWFTSTGIYKGRGYSTADWVKSATPDEVALDDRSRELGILPNSVRTPGNTTHLNAIGYTIVGTLSYEWVVLRGWLGTGMAAKK